MLITLRSVHPPLYLPSPPSLSLLEERSLYLRRKCRRRHPLWLSDFMMFLNPRVRGGGGSPRIPQRVATWLKLCDMSSKQFKTFKMFFFSVSFWWRKSRTETHEISAIFIYLLQARQILFNMRINYLRTGFWDSGGRRIGALSKRRSPAKTVQETLL